MMYLAEGIYLHKGFWKKMALNWKEDFKMFYLRMAGISTNLCMRFEEKTGSNLKATKRPHDIATSLAGRKINKQS